MTNNDEFNLSYYLDDDNNWKANKIEVSIKNIQDKRNWINNSDFLSPTIYRVYQEDLNTSHPYNNLEQWNCFRWRLRNSIVL